MIIFNKLLDSKYFLILLFFTNCCNANISKNAFDDEVMFPITTIGAYPKPDYVSLPDWFKHQDMNVEKPSQSYDDFIKSAPRNLDEILNKGTQDVINKQLSLGVDIPTDGEVRRENYIYYFARQLKGIDFSKLSQHKARENWFGWFPTITGQVEAPDEPFMVKDYLYAQSVSKQPVKITIPGPMTIMDSIHDGFYKDEEKLGEDLAKAINKEVIALAKAGAKWIQIDEPILARKPEKALKYGIKLLDQSFANLPEGVSSIVHICCGYPGYLDEVGYPKAPKESYFKIARALDESVIQIVSLEDAHSRNNPELFANFKNTKIILGVINISSSKVESAEEIREHIKSVLNYIPAKQLLIGPDCGLGFLSQELIEAKFNNMSIAVNELRQMNVG